MLKINLDDNIFNVFEENEIQTKEIKKEVLNKEIKKEIKNKVKNIINEAIKEEGLDKKNIYVNIEAVTKEEIRDLNNRYRGIDKSTDVLSFPIFEINELEDIREGKSKINELEIGDIFLCLDVIKTQSIEYKTGIKRELLYMITHGVLHLLGYDHIDENDKKIMRVKEEKILKKGDI